MIIIFTFGKIVYLHSKSYKILQNPELVRVKYGNMRIFPGTTIHRCGFKIMIYNKHFRSQLHIYDNNNLKSTINNNYFDEYKYNNVIHDQIKLCIFEDDNKNA